MRTLLFGALLAVHVLHVCSLLSVPIKQFDDNVATVVDPPLTLLHQANAPAQNAIIYAAQVFNNSIYGIWAQTNPQGIILFVTKYDLQLNVQSQTKTTIIRPLMMVNSLAFIQNNHNLKEWAGYIVCTYTSNYYPWVFGFDPYKLTWTGNTTVSGVVLDGYFPFPYFAQSVNAMYFPKGDRTGLMKCELFENLGQLSQLSWSSVAGIQTVMSVTFNYDVHHPLIYALTNCSTSTEACYMLAFNLKSNSVEHELIFNYTFASELNMALPDYFGYTQDNYGNIRMYWSQSGMESGVGFVTFDPYAYNGQGGVTGISFDKLLMNSAAVLGGATGLDYAWLAEPTQGENSDAYLLRVGGLETERMSPLPVASIFMPMAQGQVEATPPVPIPNTSQGVIGMGISLYVFG